MRLLWSIGYRCSNYPSSELYSELKRFHPQGFSKDEGGEFFSAGFYENDPLFQQIYDTFVRHGMKPQPLLKQPGFLPNGQQYIPAKDDFGLAATRHYEGNDYESSEFLQAVTSELSLPRSVEAKLYKGMIAIPKRFMPREGKPCASLFYENQPLISPSIRKALLASNLQGYSLRPVLIKSGANYEPSNMYWQLHSEARFPEKDISFLESINVLPSEEHYRRSDVWKFRNFDVVLKHTYSEDPFSNILLVSSRFYRFWRNHQFPIAPNRYKDEGLHFIPVRIDEDLTPNQLQKLYDDPGVLIPVTIDMTEESLRHLEQSMQSKSKTDLAPKLETIQAPVRSIKSAQSLGGLSPDCLQIYHSISLKNKWIKVFDLETEKQSKIDIALAKVAKHEINTRVVVVSKSGKLLISAFQDGSLRVFNLPERCELVALPPQSNYIDALAIAANNMQFAYAGNDKLVQVHSLSDSPESISLEGHSEFVESLVFTPDNKKIISSSYDRTIRIWNFKSGACERVIETHGEEGAEGLNYVKALAVTPNGKKLISGASDGAVAVWDIESGKQLHYLTGHTYEPDFEGDNVYDENYQSSYDDDEREQGVNAVAVTPDGKRIISGGDDRTVRLWDIETGRQLRIYFGHKSSVESIVIPPDGKRILSLSSDGVLNIWPL